MSPSTRCTRPARDASAAASSSARRAARSAYFSCTRQVASPPDRRRIPGSNALARNPGNPVISTLISSPLQRSRGAHAGSSSRPRPASHRTAPDHVPEPLLHETSPHGPMTCPSPHRNKPSPPTCCQQLLPREPSDLRTRGRIAPSHALVPAEARSSTARSPPPRASRNEPARSRQAPPRGGCSLGTRKHKAGRHRRSATSGLGVRALPQLRPPRRRPARADPTGGGRPPSPGAEHDLPLR